MTTTPRLTNEQIDNVQAAFNAYMAGLVINGEIIGDRLCAQAKEVNVLRAELAAILAHAEGMPEGARKFDVFHVDVGHHYVVLERDYDTLRAVCEAKDAKMRELKEELRECRTGNSQGAGA